MPSGRSGTGPDASCSSASDTSDTSSMPVRKQHHIQAYLDFCFMNEESVVFYVRDANPIHCLHAPLLLLPPQPLPALAVLLLFSGKQAKNNQWWIVDIDILLVFGPVWLYLHHWWRNLRWNKSALIFWNCVTTQQSESGRW